MKNLSQSYAVVVTLSILFCGRLPGQDVGFKDVGAAVTQLRPWCMRIVTLSVKLAGSDVPMDDLHELFTMPMIRLKDLRLQAQPPSTGNYDHYCYDPDSYCPPLPIIYPPPQSSHEYHIGCDLDTEPNPFSIPEHHSPFSYQDFLDGLSVFSYLEHVEIWDFLHIPTKTPGAFPSAVPIRSIPKLETLVVKDLPSRTRFFLAYYMIPCRVHVDLIASCGNRPLEADIFGEMLPPYQETLPMLEEATHVKVEVISDSISIVGSLSTDDTDQKCLALHAIPYTPSELSNHGTRAGLLKLTTREVPYIFNRSVVTSLHIAGDITSITGLEAWGHMLNSFYNLRLLRVDDDALGKHGPTYAIADILRASFMDGYDRSNVPICPRLAKVMLSGACYSRNSMNGLYRALAWRKGKGYQVEHCVLELQVGSDVPEIELQNTVDKLSTVVEIVSLHNWSTFTNYAPMLRCPNAVNVCR